MQGSGIPPRGSLHPHPSPAPALTDTSGKLRGQWGRAGDQGSGPRPALFSGFKGKGERSSEWDLKPVSKSLSKGSFQLALRIVSLMARCGPALNPRPGTGTRGSRGLTGPCGFHCTCLPVGEGRIPVGATAPHNQPLSLPHSSCSPLCGHPAFLSCPAADARLPSLLQTSGLGPSVGEDQHGPNEGTSGLRRK